MKICVFGLWHLGTVISACLASKEFKTVGLDFDESVINNLNHGKPPILEQDLETLVKQGLNSGNLKFTANIEQALSQANVLWIAFDTPVDEDDNADIEYVVENVKKVFPFIEEGTVVLISSQLPVRTTSYIEKIFAESFPNKNVCFAYSPENLRLGKAINAFTQADRVVIGTRKEQGKDVISGIFKRFNIPIEWMSTESAEMTKHAINAFLGTSVTFINEIASICEKVGADARQVERGLKTESRIGAKAYLKPGSAFCGGTLARDINFLVDIAEERNISVHMLDSVRQSNKAHSLWIKNKLADYFDSLENKTIAVLGLTYKPGTNTLRRSLAVELCYWLKEQKCNIKAYDPVVKSLPQDLEHSVILAKDIKEALKESEAVVITAEWNDFKEITDNMIIQAMLRPLVIDPNRFLADKLEDSLAEKYITVGKPI
ncbi:UDP-glucose dehydrogenase family protein [bacterium]